MVSRQNRLLILLIAFCFANPSFSQQAVIDSLINPASCRQIVETLAADSFRGRLSGTANEEKAGSYIVNEFIKAGCVPGIDGGYFMPFNITWRHRTNESRNIIAVLPGKSKPNEWIVFSAHYDHIGTKATNPVDFLSEKGKPEKGDSVFNGANDNASGTSALITLARYFAVAGNNERTIVFIAFAGEELGLLGSQKAVLNLNHPSIVAMINMDMLGRPISSKNKNPFITGATLSELQSILNKKLSEAAPEEYGKNFFRKDPFPGESLFSRSDNFPFAQQGVPAHTIIATHPRDRFYHSLNDEPATLDYAFLAKIVRAVALGSAGLVDGSQTPARIDPMKISE
jgi:Zn-dependent M28 family amino/carboxypeptidase